MRIGLVEFKLQYKKGLNLKYTGRISDIFNICCKVDYTNILKGHVWKLYLLRSHAKTTCMNSS